MSDIRKLSTDEVKNWLQSQTNSIFVPVHTRAEKLFEETRKTLKNLDETSRMLLDNSAKEIEKRNMKTYGRARALNKLARLFLDRLKQVKAPEQVSYDPLRKFAQETQQVLAITEVDIRNWFPRISPFFILDRRKFQTAFEKANESTRELLNFVNKEYVKTKTLEETYQLLDKLQSLKQQAGLLREQRAKVAGEKTTVEHEIADTERKMAEMRNQGSLSRLSQLDAEIDALSTEVKHSLQHLQKPFVKLQSLTQRSGGSGLTIDESSQLNRYMTDPFEAFSAEEPNSPILREILQKTTRLMNEGKLSLKPEKMRKAQQTIDSILSKDSLTNLQQKCMDAQARRRQLSTSAELEQSREELAKQQGHLENLQRRRLSVESEEKTIENAYNETTEKIRNHKSQIEKNILSFTGKTVQMD